MKVIKALLLVAGLMLLGIGCQSAPVPTATPAPEPTQEVTPVPAKEATPEPTPTPLIVVPTVAVLAGTPTPAGLLVPSPSPSREWQTPYRIQIPDLGVDTAIVAVGLDRNGGMAAPENPYTIGWYGGSAKPGSKGNVLISGHLDWMDWKEGRAKTGVFWELNKLGLGSKIIITEGPRQYIYMAKSKQVLDYNDPAALRYLQPTSTPRLTIITCEPSYFDPVKRNYQKRLLVFADLESTAGG